MTEVDRVVSRARRGRALFVSAIAALCLVVIGAVAFAIAVNVDQGSQITKVERFSCAKAPASVECQQTKRRSDRQRSIADTCIAFWKVGYACPRPSSGVTIGSLDEKGGDASQPAPTAGQPSKPPTGGGNGEGAPPKDGSDETPAPDKTAGGQAPPPPTSAGTSPAPTTSGSAPTSPPPSPEKGPEQDPPGLVKDVVKGVSETVKETGCALAKPLLKDC